MTAQEPEDTTTRRRLVVVLLGFALVLAASVPLWLMFIADDSEAAFGDSEVLDANRLGAATLDLDVGASTVALGARDMAPGDVVTGEVALANVGSLPMQVTVTASTGGGLLADWLLFDFVAVDGACLGRSGVAVDLSGPAATIAGGEGGTPALALPADASARLCVRGTLPLSAPNELQGLDVALDLVFDAVHDVDATP